MPKVRKAKKRSKARARKSSVASRSSRKGAGRKGTGRKGTGPRKTSSKKTGRKKSANELAGIRIDRLEDASATRAEKARRKKRLLEGPEEFRKIRSDRPKK